jgi:hypothetical protein
MRFAGLALILALVVNCANHPGRLGYLEIDKIPQTESAARRAKFSAYSIQDQIDIFLYSQYYIEGGNVQQPLRRTFSLR